MTKRLPLLCLIACVLVACNASIETELARAPQSTETFVTQAAQSHDATFIAAQSNYKENFLKRFFQPWNDPFGAHDWSTILKAENFVLDKFTKEPGYGENKQPIDAQWAKRIGENMKLPGENKPRALNVGTPAITVMPTPLRMLPDNRPNFKNFTDAGEGFPFDRLQVSNLPAQTPVYRVSETQDGAFQLVITPYKAFGWVETHALADVSDAVMARWKTAAFVVLTEDDIPLKNETGRFLLMGQLGDIYPLLTETQTDYTIEIAVADENNQAVTKTVTLPKPKAALFPMPFSASNIAKLTQSLLGQPYGWGGAFGYRDCSATLKDVFTAFGVWLPRNSYDQAHSYTYVDLSQLSNKEKTQRLIEQGVPFRTLIYMPGHIMLYLGEQNGQPYAFHNVWALKTQTGFHKTEGRAVIGRAVITPVDIGKHVKSVPVDLLTKVSGMTVVE